MTAEHRGWGKGFPVNRVKDMVPVEVAGVRVSVNREIAPIVEYLMEETGRRGYRLRRGECWGYANRPVRGGTQPSNHSWGLAVDLNAPANPMGDRLVTDMPAWMPALWAAWGFGWGGAYKGRPDAMHYEFTGSPDDAMALRHKLAHLDDDPPAAQVVVSPPATQPTGEAQGVKITTNLFSVPALDDKGRGWVDLPAPWDQVVSVTGLGSSPGDDGGYWPHVELDAQPRGDVTRVTIQGGEPGGRCSFWWKRLE